MEHHRKHMNNLSSTALKIVLIIVGAIAIFIGINVGFGGIETLGWQGSTDFLEVVDESRYLVQDSHVRFLGGAFGAIGLFLILATTNLVKYQQGLNLAFGVIFIGGLARFTMGDSDIIFGANIIGSLAAELILIPILAFWLSRVVKSTELQKM